MVKRSVVAIGLVAVLCGPALAGGNLVVNGSFEQTSLTAPGQISPTNVTGWSSTGYNFLYFPGTDTSTNGTVNPSGVSLYGPQPASSPDGGNFIADDGAYGVGAVSQTVNGLAKGTNYMLTFWWAAAQQTGFTGSTTENWQVSLGSQTNATATVTNPSGGFTPWAQVSMVFSATSTSQVLSFLAAGTPNGQPPFSLLDGVTLTAAPEPSAVALLLTGVAALGVFGWRRRARAMMGAVPGLTLSATLGAKLGATSGA